MLNIIMENVKLNQNSAMRVSLGVFIGFLLNPGWNF